MRNTPIAVGCLAAAMLLPLGSRASEPQATQSPATVKEVMTTMTAPGSDALFAAAANPPTTPEGWDAVRKGALLLAESGRLLLTGDRVKETDTWLEQARALVAEADAARALAESKDQEGIEAAGDRVYATCEACHARHVGN